MVETRTIPLGGTDFAGNPLPPQGTFYVPGGAQSPNGENVAGGWAPYTPPQQSIPSEIQAQQNETTGGWAEYQPPQPENARQIGSGEAAMRGALHGMTFGFYPAIAGAASGAKAALEGGDFSTAYTQTRQEEEKSQKEAEQQHPYLYTASDIAGNIPTMLIPGLGASKAAMATAEALPRIGQAIRLGATAGGLFGAGEKTSEGASPLEIAKGAGAGAVAGGATGGVLGAGVEGASQVGGKVASIVRGNRDPDAEAARLVARELKGDEKQVLRTAQDRAALNAGQQAGTDVRLVDFGGGKTRALLRTATNLSPEARDIVGETIGQRFQQQGDRIGRFIRSMFGAVDSDAGQQAIKAEARRQNGPLYKLAYRLGSGGMWSRELEQLSAAPAMLEAVQAATMRGGNRSVAEGFGAFNPKVMFNNGILRVSKKGGVPAYPDMQFWDYVQRELRDAVTHAKNQGHFEEADAIGSLHRQLLSELDRLNPAFARARGTAAAFFKASDALEAGANFVTDMSISNAMAARVLAKMNSAERQLFKSGFAAELANRIERVNDNRNVLNSIFLSNGPARQRILLALGQQDAARLEALLRIEGITDRARRALGNSTTIQQGADAAKFAGVVATVEGIKGAINPAYLIAAPLIWAGRQTAKQIDERVFTKVAELLMSDDPAKLARGLNIAVKNPTVRTALRYASDLSSRQLVNLLGPSGVAAGALMLGQHFTGAAKEKPTTYAPNDQYDYQGQYGGAQTVP